MDRAVSMDKGHNVFMKIIAPTSYSFFNELLRAWMLKQANSTSSSSVGEKLTSCGFQLPERAVSMEFSAPLL